MIAAPVVGIASAPTPQRIVCARCRGSNAANMSFCQFCGARLEPAGASATPLVPAPMQPQPMPAPMQPQPVPVVPTNPQPLAGWGAAEPYVSRRAEPRAELVIIAQDGTPGRRYPVEGDQLDIGRTEGAIALPGDPYISPRHARLARRDGRFLLRDLGSTNGIYLRLREARRLEDGDLLLVGLEVLRFELVSAAEKGLGPASEQGTQIFGSPAVPRYARLCQRTVEGVSRDVFYLTREETIIGREAGDLVFTDDPYMSRRHAAVTRDPATNVFAVRDLGSSNGTYVAMRGEFELHPRDYVRIGQHLFRLDVENDGRN